MIIIMQYDLLKSIPERVCNGAAWRVEDATKMIPKTRIVFISHSQFDSTAWEIWCSIKYSGLFDKGTGCRYKKYFSFPNFLKMLKHEWRAEL